jgi:large subunit ribosomal protein LP2
LFALTTISVFLTVGAEADEEKLEFLLTELKDKDITEVIAAGRERLSSVTSGGGAIAVGAPAAAAGGGAAPAEEAKKEEKVEEKEESDEVSVSHQKKVKSFSSTSIVHQWIMYLVCLLLGAEGVPF